MSGDWRVAILLKMVDVDAVRFRIDQPEFLHTGAGIDDAFGPCVVASRCRGEDFDDEIRRAFQPAFGELMGAFGGDEHEIGNEGVHVVQ